MKVTKFAGKTIKGISTRTNNANEMNPATAKIGSLHQEFDNNVSVDYQNGARVYGVYYDYETDASGEFSVLAGADKVKASKITLQEITLPAGDYLLFSGKGDMPQAVIDTWMKVWDYFSEDKQPKHKRAYTTDFEYYKNESEVDIYIAIA